ncbi:hypothetical protein SAMN05216436_1483 [bacterium A37T11]|nr:hypothetical protein SAMN05216436_1483 [bacterium A37T11]
MYTTTVNGDLTINFFTENDWAADLDSLMRQQPSANYIEAVEDTDIATITLRDIHWLMDRHPIFHMLTSMLQGLTISTAHIASISTKSPDERYKELFITHPEWLNRFPLKQIASYLGMTPETLSRVRARLT